MRILHVLTLTIFIISAAQLWFFPSVIGTIYTKKPALYLLPDHKRSSHLVDSYPRHNQFLAGSPILVKLQFDEELTSFEGRVTFSKIAINKEPVLDQSKKNFILPLTPQSHNGIYQVNYSVCFANDDCSDGQFAYKIDSVKITEFSNFADSNVTQVVITVSENGLKPQNILIYAGTQVRWEYPGSSQLAVEGSTFSLIAQNEPEAQVLGVTSSTEMFNVPGEYVYAVGENSSRSGRILVQERKN